MPQSHVSKERLYLSNAKARKGKRVPPAFAHHVQVGRTSSCRERGASYLDAWLFFYGHGAFLESYRWSVNACKTTGATEIPNVPGILLKGVGSFFHSLCPPQRPPRRWSLAKLRCAFFWVGHRRGSLSVRPEQLRVAFGQTLM